jgi:hypothetical protein
VRGDLSTHFLDEHLQGWAPETVALPAEGLAALALHDLVAARGDSAGAAVGGGDAGAGAGVGAASPWSALAGWRLGANGERA